MQARSCTSPSSSSWPLADLLEGWARVHPMCDDMMITSLGMDSRTIEAGALFFAIQGIHKHGLQFSRQAASRGAAAIAWEPGSREAKNDLPENLPCIQVPDLQQQVGPIATRFYRNPSAHINVTGVTGTDGKTSVSQYMAQACEQLGIACGVIGTLGYGIHPDLQTGSHTTPDAIRLQAMLHGFLVKEIPQVVIEASSHGLKQGRLNGVAVDTAIFTNLGNDHMDYHATREDYENSKRILFQSEGLKHAVINVDDAFGCQLAEEARSNTKVVSYSRTRPLADEEFHVCAKKVTVAQQKTVIDIDSSWGPGVVETGLCGAFNISNLLAVTGALLVNGHALDEVTAAVSCVQTASGRMEVVQGVQNAPTVFVDYAHTPQALISALQALRETCTGSLWCVFGCGGDRDSGKRKLMARAVESIADHAVVTDDNPRFEDPQTIAQEVISGFSADARYCVIHDRKQAIAHAILKAHPDDTVLIAGKGHETSQIINGKHVPFDDREVAVNCLREYPA